ncbi:MAG: lysophospholipid acyltransferase family protein [Planctomycetes bacterium]|nr:lysophospholipid acyltransferase family protein [Planctomycetota bacterium]
MRLRPSPDFVHALAAPLVRSLRTHLFDVGYVRQAAQMSPTGTAIFCLWHQSLMSVLAPHQCFHVAALASLSGDGQIIADYMERVGVRPVRGSSARGGAGAAKELIAALRSGFQLAIAIDGPRGPFKQAKAGPIELARRYGVPIVPIGVRATRELTLRRSWDRFRIPLPRAHLAVVYGEPIVYAPEEPTAAQVEERRQDLSRRLHALEERATRLVGKRDTSPVPRFLSWLT